MVVAEAPHSTIVVIEAAEMGPGLYARICRHRRWEAVLGISVGAVPGAAIVHVEGTEPVVAVLTMPG